MDIYKFLTGNEFIYSWPEVIGVAAAIIFSIAFTVFLYRKEKIKGSQAAAIIAFAVFMTAIFVFTVFGRVVGVRRYQLRFLWSYERIFAGSSEMLREVILNILMLVPAGALLPAIFNKKQPWYIGLLLGLHHLFRLSFCSLQPVQAYLNLMIYFITAWAVCLGVFWEMRCGRRIRKEEQNGKIISKGD